MEKARISKLRIYPIKSLGHVEIEEAEVGIFALKNDRLYAMVDKDGRYMNGKRNWKVNQLKSEYDLPNGLILLSDKKGGERKSFKLKDGNTELDNYLSDFFETKVKLIKNELGEFMDIPKASSLTVISKASLEYLQKDLKQHSLENMRLRFRTNVELSGVSAFWEEQLYQQPGTGIRFKIGEVEMIGISPRARCNVPPQNPNTGEMDYNFVKNVIQSRNNHEEIANKLLQYGRATYFLTINILLPQTETGKKLRIGDEVEILESVKLS